MAEAELILTVRNLRLRSRGAGESRLLLSIPALDLYAGEIVGLVGPSGAGKTLTALSLMGLVREHGVQVEEGEVRFADVDMLAADDHQIDRVRGHRIGLAFQEPWVALDAATRAGEQLQEPLRNVANLDAKAKEEWIAAALAAVGLIPSQRLLKAFPRRDLSGGERQRLLLALATLLRPEILIADEPAAQLDPVLRVELGQFLNRMKEERGMASVLISHDDGLVQSVADRVLTLREGELVPTRPGRPSQPLRLASQTTLPERPIVLEARGLVHFRGTGRTRVATLDNVDLTLHAGDVIGVMGASGAGKTTLVRCLAGLSHLDGGSLAIAGSRSAPSKQSLLQLVFQDAGSSFDPLMTVGESIMEGFRNRVAGHDLRLAEAERLLDLVGLPVAFLDRAPRALSGGEKQRAAIARAIGAAPAILIADEPTTALDRDAAATVIAALESLRATHPETACVIVSHDIDLLARLCTSLIVLAEGRIIEQGPLRDVLTSPKTAYARALISASQEMAPRQP